REPGYRPMSAFLHRHGTKLSRLTPGSIIDAAKADLHRTKKFAFARRHVRQARTARELIALAIKDRNTDLGSANWVTQVIYSDVERLREALALLDEAAPAEPAKPEQPKGK